ncbi:hypothetical protein FAES_3302 [Fibrella aestuarina BUZ 2]|uniref:Uncharacterized protein n=1 Tax=Fibrella aestuarina BUZ 2 TaxID=1166018 RepID=I0KB07_9BACT|nr:hypothetical protein [Fibrella aestuarina]CCH01310.1 hypothetical protein FAES_3302 [Fibrella aestuarina BUZ 2]
MFTAHEAKQLATTYSPERLELKTILAAIEQAADGGDLSLGGMVRVSAANKTLLEEDGKYTLTPVEGLDDYYMVSWKDATEPPVDETLQALYDAKTSGIVGVRSGSPMIGEESTPSDQLPPTTPDGEVMTASQQGYKEWDQSLVTDAKTEGAESNSPTTGDSTDDKTGQAVPDPIVPPVGGSADDAEAGNEGAGDNKSADDSQQDGAQQDGAQGDSDQVNNGQGVEEGGDSSQGDGNQGDGSQGDGSQGDGGTQAPPAKSSRRRAPAAPKSE